MQRITLNQSTQPISGIGLFSAQPATITIEPNESATGIVFAFKDQQIPAHIGSLSTRPAHPVFAQMKPRCTSVGNNTHTIATIEHILSALAGLGVTDAIIQIQSDAAHAEIPILDGSSMPFVEAILDAGTQQLDTTIEPIRVRETIEVRDADALISIEPSETPSYTYHIDYPDSPIGMSSVTWYGDRDEYISSVAPARTFSLEHEANQMQSLGLFTHLTPEDMLVIGDDGPIDNDFRIDEECARHKLLDLIGDLAMVGAPIVAKISANRSGHALAHDAARAILDQSKN